MQNNTISVKELNKVLNNESFSGDYSEVDIVFVAGLFLWYMQHKNMWKRIPRYFNLIENNNAWNHSHYFKQIEDLYGVKHSQIFDNFPNAYNSKANSVSRFFVPPIYITYKSIDYFFGTEKNNKRIYELKIEYIKLFDLSDFVDKTYKTYKNSINKFEKYSSEIQERLKKSSPIYVFTFIVTYKRLAQKENRTIEQANEYLEKIWQFTQTYINGLYELAKNIVEHSGEHENEGQGMITIRAYSGENDDMERIKVLETHVFDYGIKGIYETLKLNTEKNITNNEDDLFAQDYKVITDTKQRYTLKDFVEPTDNHKFLLQQFYREMAHYGLMNFKDLIEHHQGKIIASSVRDDDREQYSFPEEKINKEEISECDITKGTSYYFEMPFIPALFVKTQKTSQEPINQDVAAALSELQKFELVEYTQIDDSFQPNKNKTYLIDFKISDSLIKDNSNKIDNREIENIVCRDILDKLNSSKITSINRSLIAIDFKNIISDKSNLLRILARLSREKLSDFIVYNIDSEKLERLIDDNKNWYEKIREKWVSIDNKKIDTSYWLKDKSILFFTKYELIQEKATEIADEEKAQKDYFYFADILFGETPKSYNSINTVVSKTFPNTTFVNKQKDFDIDENYLIPEKLQNIYFSGDSSYLLPFDTLLKYKANNSNEEKELFLYNIRLILQNDLLSRTPEYDNTASYVRNFDGYHISETHFKIGNKVHSADFYYAKRLFQNSFYTTRLAVHLAKRIHNKINNINTKITLVGYEMYSELILSLTEKFLRDSYNYKDINHFVGQSGDNKMIFLPKNIFDDYLKNYSERKTVIIVPIAATGNTTQKIEKEITGQILKYERKINGKSEKEVKTLKERYKFFETNYSIIVAQDPNKKFDGIKNNKNILPMIHLPAKWHMIHDCELCYGKGNDKSVTKPLFDTDSSSLTPSLIFGNPKGHSKYQKEHEIENSIVKLDEIHFDNALNYQSVARNDNYRIYDIESDVFIENNIDKLIQWLKYVKHYLENYSEKITDLIIDFKEKNLLTTDILTDKHRGDKGLGITWFDKYVEMHKKNELMADDEWSAELNKYIETIKCENLKPTDKIVIVSPCHESNSKFINLINENVFSSSAIIIHHQNGVDFEENFNILNRNYLTGEDTKIFYVDDSLITGKHFFELFDLVRGVTNNPQPLTAAILLNDQAIPFIHERAVRWSKNYFSFVTFNQPPTLNMIDKRPLEHEYMRYDLLKESVLHDIVREHFYKKTYKLNPERQHKKEDIDSQKKIRRLKMFEATHKIYDYFSINETIPDLTDENNRNRFVDFKLKYSNKDFDIDRKDTNTKALLKVLSQYPFAFYKDLKTTTFNWHKELLMVAEDFEPDSEREFDINSDDYDKRFSTFKFLLRRAAFLSNYQVLEVNFLKILLMWFNKIDSYFEDKSVQTEQANDYNVHTGEFTELFSETEQIERKKKEEEKRKLLKQKEENLRDFPIFVLGNYIEMIQKNPWVAHRIININCSNTDFLSQFKKSKRGSQFLRMLQIESAVVIDEFMNMINKEHRIEWRDMFKKPNNKSDLEIDTKGIIKFFSKQSNDALETNSILGTNKYELVKKMFLADKDDWIKEGSPFINYLWIKQLLYADIDKDSQINITYQKEINGIMEKMKGFFSEKEKVHIFFIVTDGQQQPYILWPEGDLILNEFTNEFNQNKSLDKDIDDLKINLSEINKEDSQSLVINEKINQKQEEQKNLGTKILIDFLIGKPCPIGNSTETTSEFISEANEWINIYTDDRVKLDFLPDKTKWLYLIRISELKEVKDGNCKFETEGLLGFYSDINFSQEIFPKQLIMLLRKDMAAFINKHHKSDEFAGLIQQKEKNKYVLRLNHGVRDYEEAIENIIKNCTDENIKDDLEIFYKYLILKLNLIDKLNSETEIEAIPLRTIKDEFENKYKKVLSLNVAHVNGISKNNILTDVNLNNLKNSSNLDEEYLFPKDSIKDIIFELLNNIRKNVCNIDSWKISQMTPLIIDVRIEEENGDKYLSITNNQVRILDKPHSENDVPHGLDLLRQMWQGHQLGKIITPEYPLKENSFTIKLQLKKNENEESNNH